MSKQVKVAIVGGGPAGLFCAYELLKNNIKVHLYEKTGGVGKKFLVAGNSGLNLTHAEELSSFVKRYGVNEARFKKYIEDFTPMDLVNWAKELGTETFIGSSGRIFPKKMKAADILYQWMKALKDHPNFNLHLKHELEYILDDGDLVFRHEHAQKIVRANYYIFALGGGSWKKTGSDGKWIEYIEKLGVKTRKLKAMNCGFEVEWSSHFLEKVDRGFVKNVIVTSRGESARGEIMLTPYGLEGGAIYAISNFVRDEIDEVGEGVISIDLKPDLTFKEVLEKVTKRGKDSLTNRLRKGLGLDKVALALLYEVLDRKKAQVDKEYLAHVIKDCLITARRTRPMDEAISTSGGVCFSSLNEDLSMKINDRYYFIGEMLDFEAPTGGYLLQGCFSTAFQVAKSIKGKLNV